jgi:hypothetical protein
MEYGALMNDEKRKPKFLEVIPSKGHFIHHKSHISCSGT